MKKLLVVLLALTALSVAAFADDVVWTYGLTVKTGAQITLGDSTSTPDALIKPYDNDDGVASRLRFDAEAALGDFSAHVRIGGDMIGYAVDSTGKPLAFIPAWWTNAYFLNKMVQLQFGALDHNVTDTVNKGWGGIGVTGAQLVVVPTEGASVGVGIPVSDETLNQSLAGTKLGFSYTMPNMVTLKATYTNGGNKTADFAAGIAVLAVPNLTAQFEVQDTNLGDKNTAQKDDKSFDNGGIELFENFAYVMGPLTPGLEMYQVLPANSDLKMSMYFKPNVDYAVDSGLNIGTSVKFTTKPTLDSVNAAGDTPASALNVDPYAKFTFNDKAKVKIDFNYTIPNLSATSTWSMPININFMYSY